MTIKDSNVTIMVADMTASIAFYESIGFSLRNRWGNHYAQLTAPGITIGLHSSEENTAKNSGNIAIGFTTDDFDTTRQHLESHSISFESRTEEGGHFLHFSDPDGTALYFIKPKW
jgi:catechol 2,3-dioxygenase-like lactoylglutathione lyase family enzyme